MMHILISAGEELRRTIPVFPLTITASGEDYDITGNPDGSFEFDWDEDGITDRTLTASEINDAETSAPVVLRDPIGEWTTGDGTAEGDVWTVTPAIWAYDPDVGGFTDSTEVVRGGVGTGSVSYTLTASDITDGVTLQGVSTADDNGPGGPVEATTAEEVVGGGTAWTPEQLNAEVWLKYNDAATVTKTGSEVTALANKGTLGGSATPLSGYSGPTTETTSPNGETMMVCGADESLRITVTHDISVASAFGMVIGDSALGANRRPFSLTNVESPAYFRSWLSSATNNYWRHRHEGGGGEITTTEDNASAQIFLGEFSGSAMSGTTWRKNGAVGTGTTTNVGSPIVSSTETAITLGSHNLAAPSSGTGAGPVGEVIWMTRVLTADEKEKLEGYYAHEWGYTDRLDAGHPYKASAPTV